MIGYEYHAKNIFRIRGPANMGWLEDIYKVIKDLFQNQRAQNNSVLSGKILHKKNQPMANAIVSLSKELTTNTARDGSFIFTNLPSDSYQISVSIGSSVHSKLTTVYLKNGQHLEGLDVIIPPEEMTPQIVSVPNETEHNEKNNQYLIDESDVIEDTTGLTYHEVNQRYVLCPLCKEHIFQMWPYGWDSHSEHKCLAIQQFPQNERKHEYKARLPHLFKPDFCIYALRAGDTVNDSIVLPIILNDLIGGQARFGWSYQDDANLQFIQEQILGNYERELTDEQKHIWKHTKFLLNIKEGDYLIYINLPNLGDCSVARVLKTYSFDEGIYCDDFKNYADGSRDFRHVFEVKYINTFSRNEDFVPELLASKLKLRGKWWRVREKTEFQRILPKITES